MTPDACTRRTFLRQTTLASGTLLAGRRLWAQSPASSPVLELATPLGKLRGERADGVSIFRGVPFAEPPVGALRFRPPVSKRPWTGVQDATRFRPAAVQFGERGVPQSEDCLYLNVWAPEKVAGAEARPVFVWIHGGGFTGGEAFAPVFDGTVFARQGIIVVTLAYRLGVLGFLDLEPLLGPSYAGSANNAVRDLVAGLHWVQDNIAAFGGDPRQVTIGGESAGAKLTDLLMGVPLAKPLFHGMISESGGAERIWPSRVAQGVAEGFGKQWKASAPGRSLASLTTAPAHDLIVVQEAFVKTWPQHFPLRCELDGTLFPRPPIQSIGAGSARGKRLLIGTNRDESALFLGPHPQRPVGAADLGNMDLAAFNNVAAHYSTVYPEMPEDQRRIRAVTAEEYWVPSMRVAEAAVSSGTATWVYELDYAPSTGRFQNEAFHSEDIALVWNKPEQAGTPQAALATQMNAAWASFIRGAAPAAPGLPVWPAYDLKSRPTMLLNASSRVAPAPQAAELALWNGFQPGTTT